MTRDVEWINVGVDPPEDEAPSRGWSSRSKAAAGLLAVVVVVALSRLLAPEDGSDSGSPVSPSVAPATTSTPTSTELPAAKGSLVEAVDLGLLSARVGLVSDPPIVEIQQFFFLSGAGVLAVEVPKMTEIRTAHPFLFDEGLVAYSTGPELIVLDVDIGRRVSTGYVGTLISGTGTGEFLVLSLRGDEVTAVSIDGVVAGSTTPVAPDIANIRFRVPSGFVGTGDVSFAPNRNLLITHDGSHWAAERQLPDSGYVVAARGDVVVQSDSPAVAIVNLMGDEIVAQWETTSLAVACISPSLNRIAIVRLDGSGVVHEIGIDEPIVEWGAGLASRNIGWLDQDTLAYIDSNRESLMVLDVASGAARPAASLSAAVRSWGMEIEGGAC